MIRAADSRVGLGFDLDMLAQGQDDKPDDDPMLGATTSLAAWFIVLSEPCRTSHPRDADGGELAGFQ